MMPAMSAGELIELALALEALAGGFEAAGDLAASSDVRNAIGPIEREAGARCVRELKGARPVLLRCTDCRSVIAQMGPGGRLHCGRCEPSTSIPAAATQGRPAAS